MGSVPDVRDRQTASENREEHAKARQDVRRDFDPAGLRPIREDNGSEAICVVLEARYGCDGCRLHFGVGFGMPGRGSDASGRAAHAH